MSPDLKLEVFRSKTNFHHLAMFWLSFLMIILSCLAFEQMKLEESESSASSSTTKTANILRKSRNSELLSYKMYNDELVPIFERAPNSDYLVLSRMQRHANRKRKRRHRINNSNGDNVRFVTIDDNGDENNSQREDNQKRLSQRKRRKNRRRRIIISNNYSRQAFESLRSSVVYPSLGQALPSMLAKSTREGFCSTTPFKQKISHLGCKSRYIANNYCYGNCNSFYIPSESNQTLPFTSCAYCTPRRYHWTIIRLRCSLYRYPPASSSSSNQDLHSTNEDDNKIPLLLNPTDLSTTNDDDNEQQQSHSSLNLNNNKNQRKRIQKRPFMHAYQFKKVQIVTKCRCQT